MFPPWSTGLVSRGRQAVSPPWEAELVAHWDRIRALPPTWSESRRAWLVLNPDDAKVVLRDPAFGNDLFTSDDNTSSAELSRNLPQRTLLFMDPPRHDELRTFMARSVSAAALSHHINQWQQMVGARMSRFADDASTAEILVGDRVLRPTLFELTAHLFRLEFKLSEAEAISLLIDSNSVFDQYATGQEVDAGVRALEKLRDASWINGEGADEPGYLETAVFLMRSSMVTLTSMLLRSVALYLSSGCVPDTEHVVQHLSPTLDTGRVCQRDVTVRGVAIRRGQTALVCLGVGQAGGPGLDRAPVVFGGGIHRCLGERLVRQVVASFLCALSNLDVAICGDWSVTWKRTQTWSGATELELVKCSSGAGGARL